VRKPASSLKDDSDLGELQVTVDVPPLPQPLIDFALARGAEQAQRLREQGLIESAALFLQRSARVVGMDSNGTSPPLASGGGVARNGRYAYNPMEAPCLKYAAC
jgi:hypothetical protein